MSYVVAVVGATGVVGREMLNVLAQRKFPAKRVLPLASKRSAGSEVTFDGQKLTVEEATPERFEGVDVSLAVDVTDRCTNGIAGGDPAVASAARGEAIVDHLVGLCTRFIAHLKDADTTTT